jgi:alpha-D-ribose 1-methylphosphonate 5-triphosphate diphosphatase
MTLVLTNARLVLDDQVLHGTLHIEAGRIADVQPGLSALPGARDLEGDYVLPGAVDLLAPFVGHPLLLLVSLMDHTPGTGQYANLDRYTAMRQRDGEPEAAIGPRIAALQAQQARHRPANRAALLEMLRGRIVLASHDDRTADEIAENLADGIMIAEFPVSEAAAVAARGCGQTVIAGGPNVVRGGSHTGNVAVISLLRAGLVDALASDYVPASLVDAAFAAASQADLPLPAAIRLISESPARMVGLEDRGRIAPGLRADLVRVRVHEVSPIIRQVWLAGERVI